VQVKPGWPRQELKDMDISIQTFCSEWKVNSSSFHTFTREGKWPERHLLTARAVLARLKKKHDNAEPVGVSPGEPALMEGSAEPVGA
jgi:hypothetical protein